MAASFRDPAARSGINSDDEEAGDYSFIYDNKWMELQSLPTPDRTKRGVILDDYVSPDGRLLSDVEVNVLRLKSHQKKALMGRILSDVDEDNQQFLRRIRGRYQRVGMEIPKIEVRFEELSVEGEVYVGRRALPTLINSAMNVVEGVAGLVGISPSKKKKVQNVLHGVSGIISPSRICLLLGPPGSGKTTLLRSLAGMLDKKLRMSGRITYCGRDISELIPQRISSYINQYDMHISQMTVRETLDFSKQCLGVGGSYGMLLELLRREKDAGIKPDLDIDAFMKATAMAGQKTNLLTDYILKVIGLDICADTIVGDQMRRGISGGQKKRVTTGEMLAGPNRTLFMDDISTGLDSSTTFQIVKFMSQMVHVMDGTVLMSLLQPAPEVFDLFDDIILLSEGYIVYQGPREHVLEFFEFMGFRCPERKGVADFLQEVTSKKDQEKYYWLNKENQPFKFISAAEFAESFKAFHVGRQIMRERLRVPYDVNRAEYDAVLMETSKYGISNWKLFKACFFREWLLMKRNSFVYIFKTSQLAVMSVITMSAFFRTEMPHRTIADGTKYFNALFYGMLCMTYNGMTEMVMTIHRLPVFYKQRDFLFYPSWAFGLSYIILRIPLSLLESGIWVVLTYYTIGFAPAASRFFKQLLAFFLINQMSFSLCRFISAAGRTIANASTYGTFFYIVIFVLGGFIISKDDVQPWWSWATWLSPLTYAQNTLVLNEFLDPRWNTPNIDPNIHEPTVGKAFLKVRGMFTDNYWYWISIGALLVSAFVLNSGFIIFLKILDPITNSQVAIAEENSEDKDYSKENISPSKIISSSQNQSKGMVLPFQPLSLTFTHINYYINLPDSKGDQGKRLQLLSDVSGAFRPGVLTALVGVSGAGKTTLLDVLAGRKTQGYIEGSINLSGYPKNQASFARVTGYCEQFDIHSPFLTVYESLLFSAWMRLAPEIKQKTREMFVEEVMELVELNTLRNALVGTPGVDGLSTEQRKRLTIAVELVSNPSIIFMDEPTSGLDARSAAIVMRTVRNTVDTGRTVLCTIHQPSIDIFESFDELLLMKNGGKLIYAGPIGQRSQNLIDYFQAIPGVPKIREGQNPATWVLEISSSSLEAQLNLDFAQMYYSSSLYKRNEELINELNIPAPGSKDLSFPSKYAQGFVTQSIACFWKQRQSYWRNRNYNNTRIFLTSVSGLLFGTIFWNKGSKISKQQDLFNLLGGIYACIIFLGSSFANMVQPVIATERTVLYREKAAGMYSSLSYALAQVGIEVVYIAGLGLLYSLLLFSMMNFGWQADKFFFFLYFISTCLAYFTLFGMMLMAMTPSLPLASIVTGFFNCLWNLFAGFTLPKTLAPIWWRWYYWVCPMYWTIYGLIVSQVGDKENLVEIPGQPSMPVKDLLKETLGYEQGFLAYIAVVQLAFVLIFFFVFVYSIKFLNHQKR